MSRLDLWIIFPLFIFFRCNSFFVTFFFAFCSRKICAFSRKICVGFFERDLCVYLLERSVLFSSREICAAFVERDLCFFFPESDLRFYCNCRTVFWFLGDFDRHARYLLS